MRANRATPCGAKLNSTRSSPNSGWPQTTQLQVPTGSTAPRAALPVSRGERETRGDDRRDGVARPHGYWCSSIVTRPRRRRSFIMPRICGICLRVRVDRQRHVEIRIGFVEHALQVVRVRAVAVRAPVRVVDSERLGAVADREVGLVLRRMRGAKVRQRRRAIARRCRAIEPELREPNAFVVLLRANRFRAGRQILVRDADHGAAVRLFLCELRDLRALAVRRTQHETARDSADHDAGHACLLPD